MPLRRRRPFAQGGIMEVTAKASIAGYVNREPGADYVRVREIKQGTAWVGEHRTQSSRQLAIVQMIAGGALTDFRFLAKISHPNIARLIALYHRDDVFHVVYEYVDLDLFDICTLSEPEISEIMSQLLSGFCRLLELSTRFRIDSVRVTSSGVAKIVLDWNYEPLVDSVVQDALCTDAVSSLLYGIMQRLGSDRKVWTPDAFAFLELLDQGLLPPTTVRIYFPVTL
ncbi:hypothetical protein PT974_12188 [Cladobotryum mycophilum]|uniref:Protein kinase domain-containing protein n=1 Tax=Cladobotryum mycophilum TaxID=491253 RepID=A0ABR0S882_9HYPO